MASICSSSGILVNNTTPKELWAEPWTTTEIKKTVRKMARTGTIVWIGFKEEELPDMQGITGYWDKICVQTGETGWNNGRGYNQWAKGIKGEMEWQVWVWIRQEKDKQIALRIYDITKNNKEINNMYEIKVDQTKVWKCCMCGKQGHRINQMFGECTNETCGGIRTEGTRQDIETVGTRVRRVETVCISGQAHTSQQTETRTVFTDASGQKLNEVSGILETGWAVVEIKIVEGKTLNKNRTVYGQENERTTQVYKGVKPMAYPRSHKKNGKRCK